MRRIILPACVSIATLFLLGLGTWQMNRLAWKEALIEGREAGLAQPPTLLPDGLADSDTARAFDFRKVRVSGVFRHDLEQFFGAEARNGVYGLHVLTPLVREQGAPVLINRGWIPVAEIDPIGRSAAQFEGRVEISGIARYRAADRPNPFTPDNQPQNELWYHYDLDAMRDALEMELAPIVVEADDTPNPGGLPIGGGTRITLTNNHLQYAVTWYGLAVCLIGVYIVFRRKQKLSG
jgi:surfeit locus 1 family protein